MEHTLQFESISIPSQLQSHLSPIAAKIHPVLNQFLLGLKDTSRKVFSTHEQANE